MATTRRTLIALASVLVASLGAASAADASSFSIGIHDGSIINGHLALNDRTPRIDYQGATPGHTIVITDPTGTTQYSTPVTVGATGSGSVTPSASTPLPTGTATIQVREYGGANLYASATWPNLTVDQVPALGGPGGGTTIDPIEANFSATGGLPSFTAAGQLQSFPVLLTIAQQGGTASITAQKTADSNGEVAGLSPAQPLAPGEYTATAQTVDTDHVASSPSNQLTFYVAPTQPAITALGGRAATAGEYLGNQTAPTVTVSGVLAGADVKVFTLDPGTGQPVLLGEQTAGAAGQLTIPVGSGGTGILHDGLNHVYATQTVNENGAQVSSDGSTDAHTPVSPAVMFDVNVNTAAPTLSAAVNDSDVTSQNRPWFRLSDGTGGPSQSPGAEFVIRQDGVTVVDSGPLTGLTWALPTSLPDGTYTATAMTVDGTGNVNMGAPSNSITFTVDTTAPSAPAVLSPADGATVSTSQPPITVSTEPGATVTLAVDADTYQQTAEWTGGATFRLNGPLADGQHTINATATDAAGNRSSQTATTFTVNTSPTPPASGTNPTPPGSGTTPTPPGSGTTPTPPRTGTNPTPPTLTFATVNSHSLGASHPVKLSLSLTRPGAVTLTLTERVHGKQKAIGTVVIKAAKPGRAGYTLTTKFAGHRLGKGTYTLMLRAAGQNKTFSVALNVR
jgi:hypothetical protein